MDAAGLVPAAARSSSTSSTRSSTTAASGGCATTACRRCRRRPAARPRGDAGQSGGARHRAELRAAADVQRDAGAARRAPDAPERLVARHGAAAAGSEAGQVGRAGAADDGADVGQPASRGSTRCGRSKASARSTPALVRELMKDRESADARAGDPRERDALQGRQQVVRRRLSRADEGRRPDVAIQAMLTLNLFKAPDVADVVKATHGGEQGARRDRRSATAIARRRPHARPRRPRRAPSHARAAGADAARRHDLQRALLHLSRRRRPRRAARRRRRRARRWRRRSPDRRACRAIATT